MKDPIDVPCQKCGITISIIPIANVRTGLCDQCSHQTTDHGAEARGLAHDRLRWRKLTENFAGYLNTDWYRLPYQDKSAIALRWKYGSRGLNLWGPPKTGKTRTLIKVCEQLFQDGKRIKLFGPADFGILLQKQGWNNAAWLSSLRNHDALVFDDIGKARLSPVTEGHWFGILEYFIGVEKPILITHNFPAEKLAGRFKNGEAIVGRIREHFQSIYFGEPAATK